MKGRPGFFRSFGYAWDGLVHTVVHQRNMRVHLTSGLLVGMVGSGITLGLAEKVTLVFCVLLVFFAEVLNSALEQLTDLATEQLHERAKLAKDAAAGGVLVLALGTVVVFAVVLVHNAEIIFASGEKIARQVALGLPLTVLGSVLAMPRRSSRVVDALLFGGAVTLWAALLAFSTSYVFSGMTLGLLALSLAAARARARGAAEAQKKQNPAAPGSTSA